MTPAYSTTFWNGRNRQGIKAGIKWKHSDPIAALATSQTTQELREALVRCILLLQSHRDLVTKPWSEDLVIVWQEIKHVQGFSPRDLNHHPICSVGAKGDKQS